MNKFFNDFRPLLKSKYLIPIYAFVIIFFAWTLLIIRMFLFGNLFGAVGNGGLLLIMVFFGFSLIKSMENEIKQKEKLKSLNNQLIKKNKQLKKLDEAKSEFVSITSHHLRTPLTVTKGFLSLILEGAYGKIDGEMKEVMEMVYNSNEGLINLVENLLDISRIESGKMQYNFEKAQIEDILKEIVKKFQIKAKEKRLYLKLKLPLEKFPKMKLDVLKIKSSIYDLVDNGIKYTKKGGVKIELKKIDANNIRIEISDTGIGVPKLEIPFLFEKFSRGKISSRLHATGKGLGIFIAKKIIEAHQGKIFFESKRGGKGSKFIIELPIFFITEQEKKKKIRAQKKETKKFVREI